MFISVQLTEVVKEAVGISGLLFIFGITCLVYTIINIVLVPETRGHQYRTVPETDCIEISDSREDQDAGCIAKVSEEEKNQQKYLEH